jgi:hypothetical protein
MLLILIVVLTMRDTRPRFRFDPSPTPTPEGSAADASGAPGPVKSSDLQTLFEQARAESPRMDAAVDSDPGSLFVTNTDYASAPVYREIHEAALSRTYESLSKKDRRALSRVAKLGGFGSPEGMAQAFGYPSVDEMVSRWDQTIAQTPQFLPSQVGTNASPPLPW